MEILITGGAGFTGCNAAEHFILKGHNVTVLDNLSRKGSEANLRWLKNEYGGKFKFLEIDITKDQKLLNDAMREVDAVIHLAAQVAVTTSVTDPLTDFKINALGTFNVLEAVRNSHTKPILLYSSTNKVYGGMEDVETVELDNRYEYKDYKKGIPETRQLDFHSPYGCSKGCADQYVIDYSRIYGLKTVVFRQSCIYGYRQFGVEDQGWVAWFTIATSLDKPITIYGDGKQVRDVLFIEDLINLYDLAIQKIDLVSGKAYNIGGGSENTLSLIELISLLEGHFNKKIEYKFDKWRPGDQPVFVCDISKIKSDLGWAPQVSVNEGVKKLAIWVKENKELFKNYF